MKSQDNGCRYYGEKSGEEEGMRESAMSPKIAVVNAEAKADDVDVGNY